jgi:hypothetical protein
VESTGKHEIRWIGRDEDCRGNIGDSELSVNPSPWMDDIAGYSSHIGEESRAGQDNWIVANEAPEDEEEGVQVEEQQMPNLACLLKHFERQPPDQAGSVDGNSNVCQ